MSSIRESHLIPFHPTWHPLSHCPVTLSHLFGTPQLMLHSPRQLEPYHPSGQTLVKKKKKGASQMPLQFNFRFFFINKKSLRWLIAIGCRPSLWSVRHAVNNFTFLKLLENYKANCVWLEAFLWYEKYMINFWSIKFHQ